MSWQLRATETAIRGIRALRPSGSPDLMQARIDQARVKPVRFAPPARLARSLELATTDLNGVSVYDVQPPGVTPARWVCYLHGGSYTFEITPVHWRFISDMVKATSAGFTVPIYRLAPEMVAEQTVPAMTDLVERIIDQRGAESVTLMGDSAGGGMALAVAQQLRDRGKQPNRIVLISPWLDVTLPEPKAREIEPHDVMLSVDGLRYCGGLYAGALEPTDPRVSPLYGEMTGLAPVDLFIGTHDVLYADVPSLVKAMERDGTQLRVHEGPKLLHDFPLLALPESREARATIVDLVRS
jgi:acetyl esterase/lipase